MSSKVKSHFILWTKESCPFCCMAIEFLESKKISHNVFTMDDDLETLDMVKEKFEWSTVPLIIEQVVGGDIVFVGGFTDLTAHLGVPSD